MIIIILLLVYFLISPREEKEPNWADARPVNQVPVYMEPIHISRKRKEADLEPDEGVYEEPEYTFEDWVADNYSAFEKMIKKNIQAGSFELGPEFFTKFNNFDILGDWLMGQDRVENTLATESGGIKIFLS